MRSVRINEEMPKSKNKRGRSISIDTEGDEFISEICSTKSKKVKKRVNKSKKMKRSDSKMSIVGKQAKKIMHGSDMFQSVISKKSSKKKSKSKKKV